MPRARASVSSRTVPSRPSSATSRAVLLGVLGVADLELALDHAEHVHRDPGVERDADPRSPS